MYRGRIGVCLRRDAPSRQRRAVETSAGAMRFGPRAESFGGRAPTHREAATSRRAVRPNNSVAAMHPAQPAASYLTFLPIPLTKVDVYRPASLSQHLEAMRQDAAQV
jgi:hypothetical protein